jgi:hypothetical protein
MQETHCFSQFHLGKNIEAAYLADKNWARDPNLRSVTASLIKTTAPSFRITRVMKFLMGEKMATLEASMR